MARALVALVQTRDRVIGAAELVVGAAVVIGHNVFRVVPNEVPILVVLGLASARLRNGSVAALGFARPGSWRRLVLIALAAATVRVLLGELVIVPLTSRIWPAPVERAEAAEITGNLMAAALALLLVWSFAAFGEEIGYRGYLLRRAAEAGGGSTAAYWAASVLTGVLFGIGHWYKGPAGVVDSGIAGLILAGAYMLAGRNLWASVLAHGFIDTFAVVVVYLGLAD